MLASCAWDLEFDSILDWLNLAQCCIVAILMPWVQHWTLCKRVSWAIREWLVVGLLGRVALSFWPTNAPLERGVRTAPPWQGIEMLNEMEGEFFCSACGHHLQDLTYLVLDCLECPTSEYLVVSSLAAMSFILTSGPEFQTLGRGLTVGSPWSSSVPHPLEGVG